MCIWSFFGLFVNFSFPNSCCPLDGIRVLGFSFGICFFFFFFGKMFLDRCLSCRCALEVKGCSINLRDLLLVFCPKTFLFATILLLSIFQHQLAFFNVTLI
jgi:hypothetical protein